MLLEPNALRGDLERAATHEGATALGRPVAVGEMDQIDLVVCGSVAVNRQGARVGKGGGFSDIEVALLVEAGLLTEQTQIVTTVHDVQVLEETLPETDHDFRLDWIVTPREVIRTSGVRRLPGLFGRTSTRPRYGQFRLWRPLIRCDAEVYRRYAPRATGAKLVVLPLDARDVSDCGKIVSLLLRAEEVAELLGISRSKVGDMIWRSDLPSVRMGRLVRVPRSGLEEWIARRSEVPRAAVQLIR